MCLPVPPPLVGARGGANASVSRAGRPPGFGHPAAAARLAGVGQLGAEWSVEGFAALVAGCMPWAGGAAASAPSCPVRSGSVLPGPSEVS